MDWRMTCCAVQGRGHIKTKTPCQDAVAQASENGIQAIVLADGAGSAAMSHYGARCVAEHMAAYFVCGFQRVFEQDVDGAKRDILAALRNALEDEAGKHNCEVWALASTLLAVAVCDDRYIGVHIGDGVIGALDDAGLKVASYPHNGEFVNETTFVTSENALPSMRLFKGESASLCGFVLMSDGTGQSLYHKRNRSLAPAVVRLMHWTCLISARVMCERLEETLRNVVAPRTPDDCSIAMLARPSVILKPYNDLSMPEKSELFQIDRTDRRARNRVLRYDSIIRLLKTPRPLSEVARGIHLSPKHTKKLLERLLSLGLLKKDGAAYMTPWDRMSDR